MERSHSGLVRLLVPQSGMPFCGRKLLYMFTVYIIQSFKNCRYYIGHTANFKERFKKHNNGLVRSTKSFIPWKVVYIENYKTKSEAYRRELEIKSYKGGYNFKKLLSIIHGEVA